MVKLEGEILGKLIIGVNKLFSGVWSVLCFLAN